MRFFTGSGHTINVIDEWLANGILDGVNAALAYHVGSGRMPTGLFMYNSGGTMMYSVDGFRITVYGRGAHGAYPLQ
jgi:metal-dependent amidase/aminoacylase/carboxypeptidase family protein